LLLAKSAETFALPFPSPSNPKI